MQVLPFPVHVLPLPVHGFVLPPPPTGKSDPPCHARVRLQPPPPRPGTALSNYLGFVDFIINMAPGVLMAAVACIPLILFLYRHTLVPPIQRYQAMLEEVRLPWRRLPTLPGR